ncbi:hypothetical protein [Lysinibacillus sp. NPDC047702]|uniref:hypothetical protein n=1 Tax=unclassified Lysinibacillus TaxID=2636778 RepID=UPI003D075699
MTEKFNGKIHLHGYDIEYFEVEKNPLSNDVTVQVNYLGYPDRFSFGSGETIEEAVENGVKMQLKTHSLESIKKLFD